MTLMTGEIEYDNLLFPVRSEITPKYYMHFQDGSGRTLLIPNLTDADINTFSKAQYFPGTAHIIGFLAILLVAVVIFNLILGIAVSDVQVKKGFREPTVFIILIRKVP